VSRGPKPLAESVRLHASFGWGMALVADERAQEPIPSWTSCDATVAASTSSLVIRVVHAQDGRATVLLTRGVERAGTVVFRGRIDTLSGRLRASARIAGRVGSWAAALSMSMVSLPRPAIDPIMRVSAPVRKDVPDAVFASVPTRPMDRSPTVAARMGLLALVGGKGNFLSTLPGSLDDP
jgi:hypothetical protein